MGNCTPGVPDKMSVVAAVAEPRPGRQKLGPGWPGLVISCHQGQCTVQQARVTAQQKIWEPSDMSSLHYFLH